MKRMFTIPQIYSSKTPSYIILYVTAVCQARCPYCFYWEPIQNANRKNELTLDEMRKISEKFDKIMYLTITGGEPFLRKDLNEVIKTFVANNNVQFVSIPTNGGLPSQSLPLVEDMLKSCPQTGFRVALSIDAIGKEHDELRRVKDLFNKILETYEGLAILREKYRNLNIDVTTVYSKYTEGRIEEIFDYVRKNLKIDNHVMNLARGDVQDPIIKDINIAHYEKMVHRVEDTACNTPINRRDFRLKLLKAIKLVMRDVILDTLKKKKMILPCVAGEKFVMINEKGEVYPCDIFINHKDKLLGSLREHDYDIKKVLASAEAKGIVKWIKDTKCHCTFECGIQNNILFNPIKAYPKVLMKLAKVQ